jgi:hypothetical protein
MRLARAPEPELALLEHQTKDAEYRRGKRATNTGVVGRKIKAAEPEQVGADSSGFAQLKQAWLTATVLKMPLILNAIPSVVIEIAIKMQRRALRIA